MSDLEITLAVSLVGVVTWTAAVLFDRLKSPVMLVGLVLAISFVIVSELALRGDPLVPVLAAFNRGLVAAVGLVLAVDRAHRWRAQRQRSRERR